VITFGQGPTLPSLVHLGSVAALRRGGEIYGWCDFFFFFFLFLDRATDKTESARSAQNGSKDADSREVVPFEG